MRHIARISWVTYLPGLFLWAVAGVLAMEPRYIALDVAIVGQLSREDQLTVARLVLALTQRDFMEIIRVAHRAGWLPPGADLGQLADEVHRIAGRALDVPIDQLEFGPIMVDLLDAQSVLDRSRSRLAEAEIATTRATARLYHAAGTLLQEVLK